MDAILPISSRLSTLPTSIVDLLFKLLEESIQGKQESFMEVLAVTSLSKCVMNLVRQMNVIELKSSSSSSSSLLHHLENRSMVATSTPGEPVAPFITSVLISTMFNKWVMI